MHEHPLSDFSVEDAPRRGKGIYTRVPLTAGETIFFFKGERLTTEEVDARTDVRDDDPLQVQDEEFLILEEPYYFANHSCSPNTGVRGESELFALRDITEGEELTFDYSTTMGEDVEVTMQCACESPTCRKSMGNVTTIPRDTQDFYCSLGAFPDFIKARICTA